MDEMKGNYPEIERAESLIRETLKMEEEKFLVLLDRGIKILNEEISKIDPSIGLSVAAHNSLCTNHIYLFGNEQQRCKWLPKLSSGEHIGAWALTEYETGSDAKAMNTVAKKVGDNWIINGSKNFITHGRSGDIAVIIARTGEKNESRGMTAFVIERGTKGFTCVNKLFR